MNGRTLCSVVISRLPGHALGTMLLLMVGLARTQGATPPNTVPGISGQGKSLGPANFTERALQESPVRPRPSKSKPFHFRYSGSAPALPVDPALIGRGISPRQSKKAAAPAPSTSSTAQPAPLVEADAGGNLFTPAAAGTSPSPSASFPAVLDDGFSSVPDTQGAVGPNHLMATLASQIRVQDRMGNTNLTMTLSNFWSSTPGQPGLDVYDPRVVYDSLGQRWIHVANANPADLNPGLLIAVSQTTDPTGLWNRYFIDVDTVNGIFIDSPNVGFTKDWITVSANTFDSTNFEYFGQEVWVFNKARLYANQSAQFTRFAPNVPGGPANVPVPVSTYDATLAVQHLVGHYDGDSDGAGYLRVYTISGSIGNEAFTAGAFITDIGVGSPPWSAYSPNDDNFGPQLGTTNKLYLGDARIVNGAYRESSSTLWVAHTIFLPSDAPTHSAVQWWEFTPGGAVVQRGRINDVNAVKFYAYPSIAVSRGLDVVVGYSRFGANQFPSANYSYRVDDDLLSTTRPDTVLKAGESNYVAEVNGFNVWGDWSATAVDPANDTDLWTLQEYAAPHVLVTNVVGSVTNIDDESRWGTWWGRISPIRDLTLTMADAPDPIVAGGNVTYTLSFTNARPPNAQPQIVPGTRIVDTLPAGSVFVSVTPNQGSCAATGGVVTCDFGNLAVGATGRVTIVATLLNGGTAVNTATLSASGPDPTPAGNTVSVNTTVSSSADIAVLMTAAPDPVTVSNQLVFSLVATNRGPSTATGVLVTNTLPANVTYVSSSPSQGSCSRNGSIVTCNLGAITALTAVTVDITVTPNAAGQYTNRATIGTSAIDPNTSNNAASAVSRANSAPTIGVISDRTINEDTVLGPISFTVGDVETPATSLTLFGVSSNTNIVPNANIAFAGSGSTRMVTVTPAPNANGVVTITRFVMDAEGATGSNSFQLTITPMNDAPFISDIPSQTINEDTVLAPVAFTVGDIESGASGLSVSGASSNPTLVPNANIMISGTGSNRTVAITPATNQFGTAFIAISVSDGQSVTNKSFLLTVLSVNDLPTITDLPDRTVNEDTVVGPLSFAISDVETSTSSLIPSGFSSNPTLVPNGNITFGGSGSSRTVTILPATNQFGTTTITISISDGSGSTNDTFILTVNPVNDPPTLNAISDVITTEDSGPVNISLAGIGSGAANETQVLSITASSSNPGLVPTPSVTYTSPNSTGTLSFTPTPNSNGTATITVTINDNAGSNNITTRLFNVTVLPVNDPPFISSMTDLTLVEDGSTNLSFVIGDPDSALGSLTLLGRSSNTNLVPNGNIVFGGGGSNRNVTITPASNADGSCLITVSVSDGTATNSTSFTLTVLPVNDPPTLSTIADRVINEDAVTNLNFTVGDAETPLANLLIAATSANQAIVPNQNLSITGNGANRTLVVVPTTNQAGSTVIALTVTDEQGATNMTSFLLTVVSVNDPPTLDAIANLTIAEDSGQQTVTLSGISSGAPNEAQTLAVTAFSSNPGLIPTPQVTYTSPGTTASLRFTPVPDSNGVANITVTVDDGAGGSSTFSRMFTVTVTNINDPPTISGLNDLTIDEDATTNRTFVIADSDNAPNTLILEVISSNEELIVPDDITFGGTGTTRTMTFRPLTNQFGSATITVTVRDPSGASASDSFELTVLPANDPPGISPLANVTLNEDTPSSVISFTVDSSETLPSSLTVSALSSNPTLLSTNNIVLGGSGANRTFRLFPSTNQFGTSTVTLIVSDGVLSSSNSFLLTVLSVNDLPSLSTFSSRTIDEDTSTGPIDITVGDVETAGSALILSGSSSDPALLPSGSFIFGGSGSNRTVSILPATNRFGTATVTIAVADLNGGMASNSFVLTVNPVNDPPVLNALANIATNRDAGPITVSLSGIGPGGFGEVQTLAITASSSNPEVVPNPVVSYTSPASTGSLVFTPVPTTNGSAMITVTVTDNAATNNSFSRTFIVTTVLQNRPPTLNPIPARNLNEDAGVQVVNFNGVSSGSPAETQILTVTASSSNPGLIPTPTVTYTSPATNGSLTFTPVLNANGTANITVTVNDNGGSNNLFSQVFTVTVAPVNDPPTLSPVAPQSTLEDTPFSFGVTVGDVDTPLSALVLSAISSNPSLVQSGSFAFSGTAASRTVVVTPLTNANGSAVVTLIVSDGNGGSASNSFLLNVTSVPDLPSISDIPNQTIAEDSQPTINFTVSDPEGSVAALMLTASSSNAGLLPASAVQFGGSGANRSVTLKPLANRFGSATITVVATATSGVTATDSFVVTVTNVNDAPTLSGLPSLTINEDTPTGPLSITLGDLETPLANLTPSASSSNPTLVPAGNIVMGGSGPDRTVTITPAANQFGTSLITLSLADGNGGSTNTSFVLNVSPVNDPPTLNPIANIFTNNSGSLIFVPLSGITAGGGESQALAITATSGNPALIPNPGISYASPSSSGTLTLAPQPNAVGQALISVTVNDGSASNNVVTRSFTVTVDQGNSPPTISAILNQQINEDNPLTTGFVIGDRETLPMSLGLSATSTNTTLVPNANILFNGNGSNQTLIVLPATNQFGTTLITVSVNDGLATNSTSFVLTVNPVNDPPTLGVIPNFTTNSASSPAHLVAINGLSTGASNENQTLTITAVSSNPTFLPNPSVSYSNPATNGVLTLRPGSGQQGNATVTVTVTEGGATSNNTVVRTFQVNIKASANVPPAMSIISNQTMQEDGVLGPIGFTVGDSTTAAASLLVRIDSSNPTLLPTNNIILGGSGANRTLTLIPTLHQSGVAVVFLTVIDTAFGASNQTFTVTVNPANDSPTISAVGAQISSEDSVVGPILFNVSDVETPAANLIVTASSSNPTLVPNANILLGGYGSNRAVRILPATNQAGSANITLNVSDGAANASTSFTVTWNPANDAPTISDIPDQTINRDTATAALAFTVADAETAAGSLFLSANSSNPSLIPLNRIVFGGSGNARTVAITPASNQVGTATITITVSDGTATSSDTFLVIVNTVDIPNVPPTLNALANISLPQNAPAQTVNLTGIGSGSVSESQTLIVAASSSNPDLIPNPAVTYTSPNNFGTLTLVPCPNTNGTAIITVRVNDGQILNNLVTRTFTVTINATPTIAGPTNVLILEDGTVSGVPFTLGDVETPAASLTVQAFSSNTGLLPNGNVVAGGFGANRTLSLTPLANQSGFSTITLAVMDGTGNTSSNSFLVTVVPVNDAPTLNPLNNLSISSNAGQQTVPLSGIGSGAANESQLLLIQATSSNPSIIPDPAVNYASPGSIGTLNFTPVANATGVVVITVRVMDDGGTANSGSNSITRTFTVTVSGSGSTMPALQIDRVGANIVLSWPTSSGSTWVLQHNANITNRNGWTSVGITPTIVANRYTVTIPANASPKFYRLCNGCVP